MTKLKHDKLVWALTSRDAKEFKNEEIAASCGVKVRRLLQLKAEYKRTGKIPVLNPRRRPKRVLTGKEKEIIDKAYKESSLGATLLRLYILKNFKVNIPHNKIHEYLLAEKFANEDIKKKKSRTASKKMRISGIREPFSAKYTGSLGHIDCHASKCIPGKKVVVYIDDASRQIVKGLELNKVTDKHLIGLIQQTQKYYWNMYNTIINAVHIGGNLPIFANQRRNREVIAKFREALLARNIKPVLSGKDNPYITCKNKRWFRTYEEHRPEFKTFDQFVEWYNNRIHGGLSRKTGITPHEAAYYKLRPESWLGLFFRQIENAYK